jgi:hypothetical protein
MPVILNQMIPRPFVLRLSKHALRIQQPHAREATQTRIELVGAFSGLVGLVTAHLWLRRVLRPRH